MPLIVEVNLLAVLVAAVASMVIGFLWYSQFLFGKQWMALSGLDEKKMKGMKMGANKAYLFSFIGALVMADVLAHASVFSAYYFSELPKLTAYLMTSFWSWLGFVMPVQAGMVLFGDKPFRLFLLNTGYQLVSLIVMGLVLALM